MSRIGFVGVIDRLRAVESDLSDLPIPAGMNAAAVSSLRAQVGESLSALIEALETSPVPPASVVDGLGVQARLHVDELGRGLGVADETGEIIGEGPTALTFAEISDSLSDVEVAWRNQRSTLIAVQSVRPHRRLRYMTGGIAAAVTVLMVMWLLLHNQQPQALAAAEGPGFPVIPPSSVPPPSKLTAPPFDTNLHYTPRPNTTPPLVMDLPQETRSRTPGSLPSIDISTLLPQLTPSPAPSGPLIVDPQNVQQSCNENNTYLSPLGFHIVNNTGGPVSYSAAVSGNWATVLPAAGQLPDGQQTVVTLTPTFDSNGHPTACEQLVNTGKRSDAFHLTITVNNSPYLITDTISLF